MHSNYIRIESDPLSFFTVDKITYNALVNIFIRSCLHIVEYMEKSAIVIVISM